MAFEDFVRKNGWGVYKIEGPAKEIQGHTIRIDGSAVAPAVICEHDLKGHTYPDPIYYPADPGPERIQGRALDFTITLLPDKGPSGRDQIRCSRAPKQNEDDQQTPSWTAEDRGTGDDGNG